MSANFYEAELRNSLRTQIEAGVLKELGDSSRFFEQVARAYPVIGSRIDWKHVPGSIERVEEVESLQVDRFLSFFDEIVHTFSLDGDIVYIGDSATEFSLCGSVKTLRAVLPELLAVPQHHYFIGPNVAWCVCFTMEGDMGFGFSPKVG